MQNFNLLSEIYLKDEISFISLINNLSLKLNIENQLLINTINNITETNAAHKKVSEIQKIETSQETDSEKFIISDKNLAQFKGRACTIEGCKVQKITKPHLFEDKLVCSTHFKLLNAKKKKETKVQCKHINVVGKHYGEQCTSKSVCEDGFCKRHSRGSDRIFKIIRDKIELPSQPVEEIDWWVKNSKVVTIKNDSYILHKLTNFCFRKINVDDSEKIEITGYMKIENGLPVYCNVLDEKTTEWCQKSSLIKLETQL